MLQVSGRFELKRVRVTGSRLYDIIGLATVYCLMAFKFHCYGTESLENNKTFLMGTWKRKQSSVCLYYRDVRDHMTWFAVFETKQLLVKEKGTCLGGVQNKWFKFTSHSNTKGRLKVKFFNVTWIILVTLLQ